MHNRGTYIEFEGRPAVQFERNYPCSAERVWTAITDPNDIHATTLFIVWAISTWRGSPPSAGATRWALVWRMVR